MKKYIEFLNESEIRFDSVFKTEVNGVTIYGDDELAKKVGVYNIDVNSDIAYVTWILQPDMRNNRIKSMDLLVTKVKCNITWSIDYDEQEQYNGPLSGVIEFDTESPEYKDWEIITSVYFEKDGGVCPDIVEIDFKTKKITVE